MVGLTQADLAERVDVATETISRLERGVTSPTVVLVGRIADALQLEPWDLLRPDRPPRRAKTRHEMATERFAVLIQDRTPAQIQLALDMVARALKG